MAKNTKKKATTNHDHRPTLNATEPGIGRELTLAFGYMNNEPTAALFVGDSKEPILLPREFLQIAVEQGWSMECSDCKKTS